MISFRRRKGWQILVMAAGITLAQAPLGAPAALRRVRRFTPRVVTIRQVVVRREPVVIHAVTMEQLRAELRRSRISQAGYERQVAQQYQTIRRLQAQVDSHLQELREASSQRAAQLDAQYDLILQAFGLIVFAIIGGLLIALCRSDPRLMRLVSARPSWSVVDWEPLEQQLSEARSTLATVESRLRRLETSITGEGG
jgi:hypothetical protein